MNHDAGVERWHIARFAYALAAVALLSWALVRIATRGFHPFEGALLYLVLFLSGLAIAMHLQHRRRAGAHALGLRWLWILLGALVLYLVAVPWRFGWGWSEAGVFFGVALLSALALAVFLLLAQRANRR